MADLVEYALESTIPELDELLSKGLFTKAEIKSIVKKRTNFEYALKRRFPEKRDFLRYVDFEINLLSLKEKRVDRGGLRKKDLLHYWTSISRVHRIFNRAKNRFPADIRIWEMHHEFCKREGSYNTLAKSYARAIQQFPTIARFWIQAAEWELEHNKNISNARALFQRALRLNSESKEIWLEYFSIELLFIRKQIQKIDVDIPVNDEDTVNIDKLEGEEDQSENQQMKQQLSKIDALSQPFFTGAIPKVIYKSAIQKIPHDPHFRMDFVKRYSPYLDIDGIKEGVDAIYQSLADDFPHDADCLRWLAEHSLRNVDSTNFKKKFSNSFDIFENALKSKSNPTMWCSYAQFCKEQTDFYPKFEKNLHQQFQLVCEKAKSAKMCSMELFELWAQWLQSRNQKQQAAEILKIGTDTLPTSSKLWLLRLKQEKNLSQLDILYQEAFRNKLDDATQIWKNYVIFCIDEKKIDFDEVLLQIKKASSALVMNKNGLDFKLNILEKINSTYGIERTRKVYELIFSFPPIELGVFKKCIQFEKDSKTNSKVVTLYEKALLVYGETLEDLWLEYIIWCIDEQDFSRASTVYWKAKHNLNNPTEFVKNYVMYMNRTGNTSLMEEKTTEEEPENLNEDNMEDDD